jgi:hypothetical protein
MRIEPRRGGAAQQSSSCPARQTGANLALSSAPAPTRILYASAPAWGVAPRAPDQPLKSFLLWRCRRENLTPRGFRFRFRLRGLLHFFLAFIFVSHERKHDTDARPRKVPQRIPVSHRRPVPHPSGACAPHLDFEMWESTNPNTVTSTQHEHWVPHISILRCGKARTLTSLAQTVTSTGGKTSTWGDRPNGSSRSCASSLQPQIRPAKSYKTFPGRRCALSPPMALSRLPRTEIRPPCSVYRPAPRGHR